MTVLYVQSRSERGGSFIFIMDNYGENSYLQAFFFAGRYKLFCFTPFALDKSRPKYYAL